MLLVRNGSSCIWRVKRMANPAAVSPSKTDQDKTNRGSRISISSRVLTLIRQLAGYVVTPFTKNLAIVLHSLFTLVNLTLLHHVLYVPLPSYPPTQVRVIARAFPENSHHNRVASVRGWLR